MTDYVETLIGIRDDLGDLRESVVQRYQEDKREIDRLYHKVDNFRRDAEEADPDDEDYSADEPGPESIHDPQPAVSTIASAVCEALGVDVIDLLEPQKHTKATAQAKLFTLRLAMDAWHDPATLGLMFGIAESSVMACAGYVGCMCAFDADTEATLNAIRKTLGMPTTGADQ